MAKETKKVFKELISLYDIADQLEDNGQEEDAEEVRTKLNNITDFFVKNFKKDLDK
jgi:aspartate/tyrosine/aromatic aminotransferase